MSVNADRTYFDTDPGDHHHFYVADEDRLMDVPEASVSFASLPQPPAGYEIDKVDVVVHLKTGTSRACPEKVYAVFRSGHAPVY